MGDLTINDFVEIPWGVDKLTARVLEISGFGPMRSALLCVAPDEHGPGTCGDTVRYLVSELESMNRPQLA